MHPIEYILVYRMINTYVFILNLIRLQGIHIVFTNVNNGVLEISAKA